MRQRQQPSALHLNTTGAFPADPRPRRSTNGSAAIGVAAD